MPKSGPSVSSRKRETMFTVSVIGPDGAGKSTLLEQLPAELPMPVKRIYMGIRFESSNTLLPTTRLLLAFRRVRGTSFPPLHGAPPSEAPSRKGLRRVASRLRSILLLLNLFAEEWYRQALAWVYLRRGFVVLFDRHFLADYYAFDLADTRPGRDLGTRLHGFLLERFYPPPDLVIYLEAPPEVLFARKGEGTLDRIRRMQEGYRRFGARMERFVSVDATKPQDEVLREVAGIIQGLSLERAKMRSHQGAEVPG